MSLEETALGQEAVWATGCSRGGERSGPGAHTKALAGGGGELGVFKAQTREERLSLWTPTGPGEQGRQARGNVEVGLPLPPGRPAAAPQPRPGAVPGAWGLHAARPLLSRAGLEMVVCKHLSSGCWLNL